MISDQLPHVLFLTSNSNRIIHKNEAIACGFWTHYKYSLLTYLLTQAGTV